MKPGQFIVLEGVEGAGKSTAIEWINAFLKAQQIETILTREPGGTLIAEEIRTILKTNYKEEVLSNQAELLLFYAARIQLVETVIVPALQKGTWVIGDRHDLSTQAYQGAGRKVDPVLLQSLKKNVLKSFKPDLTLYLDLDPEIGMQRARSRGELDRFEQEEIEFFHRVRAQFLKCASQDESIVIINAEQSMSAVQAQIIQAITQRFFS